MPQKSKNQQQQQINDTTTPSQSESETSNGCCPCFKKVKKTAKAALNKSKVAYTGDLPKDLKTGKTIVINGLPLSNCSRFSVDLLCGKDSCADIGFHFNPRLVQRYIVRNSRYKGEWQNEETASIWTFPFERNKKFSINIFIGNEEFLVSLDGKHICAFRFRMPLSKLTILEVNGPVEVYAVEYKDLKIYPDLCVENKPFTVTEGPAQRYDEVAKTAMAMPVTALLPKGLQANWQLEIYGRVKLLPHSFYINLQEGAQIWPHPIVHLHLNPRFCTSSSGDSLFVRNAWIDGRWGQEERVAGFQFSPGSSFTVAIRRGSDHFSVWIDEKLAGEFKFRSSPDKIDTLCIQGDVAVFNTAIRPL